MQINFRWPQIAPEAWLGGPVFAGGGAGEGAAISRLGPYLLENRSPQQVSFARRPGQPAGGPSQPGEIVERTYRDASAAIRALKRGEISVLDRVSPWELPRLGGGDITVARYALPRVHLLVPNPHRPLTAHRTFRRALAYGIDRAGILNRGLLDGQTIAGCEPLTGPFPRGEAYNAQVESRPYDPGLALALVRVAVGETDAARQQRDEQPLASPPTLVLAHPAEPIARVACQSIARQLRALGLGITTRELAGGEAPPADADLLYADLACRDPLVDAWRLLGPGGLVGDTSPALLAALRSLESQADRAQAASVLQEIHRLAAAELPVIPLWQLADHLAYHKSVQGIGPQPVTLYEDVERWQAAFRIPTE